MLISSVQQNDSVLYVCVCIYIYIWKQIGYSESLSPIMKLSWSQPISSKLFTAFMVICTSTGECPSAFWIKSPIGDFRINWTLSTSGILKEPICGHIILSIGTSRIVFVFFTTFVLSNITTPDFSGSKFTENGILRIAIFAYGFLNPYTFVVPSPVNKMSSISPKSTEVTPRIWSSKLSHECSLLQGRLTAKSFFWEV